MKVFTKHFIRCLKNKLLAYIICNFTAGKGEELNKTTLIKAISALCY